MGRDNLPISTSRDNHEVLDRRPSEATEELQYVTPLPAALPSVY